MNASQRIDIGGQVSPGFEAVRDAFIENFFRRHELGGACCMYHRGEKVVDLWGGIRNKATGEPWEEGTMVLVYSTTKDPAAMTLALAHSRGWLDYEERVASYWPEFAHQGKERITVRQLLAHQAGLFAFDGQADRGLIADLDRLAVLLAGQKPAWEPRTRQAYHAITLGYYEGELLRRVDPQHRFGSARLWSFTLLKCLRVVCRRSKKGCSGNWPWAAVQGALLSMSVHPLPTRR